MATDFNKSVVLNGGVQPSSKDTPGDIRTRIQTIADVESIPVPFIGMIFYVIDENKYYKVLSLKGKQIAGISLPDMLVDAYEELMEGYATEEFVEGKVEGKVDKEEGKGLIDLQEAERLAGVDNYDDTEVREMIDGKADVDHTHVDLVSKEELDVKGFLTEHQDISHLAVKAEVEEALEGKADIDHMHEEASIEEVLAMYNNMQEEVPAPIDDVVEEAVVINAALVDFKASVYNQPAGSDLQDADVNAMYVAVQLPENEVYGMADKTLKIGGEEVPQALRMSVGNNNFIEFDQYKVEGNELKVSIPTMLLADEPNFVLEATGFKDEEFAISVPAMQESVADVKKEATFNADQYNVVKVADNEFEVQLVSTVQAPSWSQKGMILVLFDLCNIDGVSVIEKDSTFITKKEYSYGAEALGMTAIDNMAAFGEEAKPHLALYLPVGNVAYDLKYKAILIGAEYKCMNVVIHVPANI